MGATGPLQVVLFVAVAVVAASCGFLISTVRLRKKRRARVYFVLGVVTGLVAAAVPRGRFRAANGAIALGRGLLKTYGARSGSR
jgi:hypothetical protein